MSPDKPWKQFERRASRFFGGVRNSLSGRQSKAGAGDMLHENLVGEFQQRKRHTAVKLWDKCKAEADKEGKLPVVALAEHNRPGFWVLVHSSDLVAVAGAHKWAREKEKP